MANEVTTAAASAGELIAAEIVSRLVIDAAYAEAVLPPLVRVADISSDSTLSAVEFSNEKPVKRPPTSCFSCCLSVQLRLSGVDYPDRTRMGRRAAPVRLQVFENLYRARD